MTCGRSEKSFKNTEYTRHAKIINKRTSSEKQFEQFILKLHEFDWTEILVLEDTNKTYDDLLNIYSTYYSESFLKVEIKLKRKSVLSPWITKGILKSSKRKQYLIYGEKVSRFLQFLPIFAKV